MLHILHEEPEFSLCYKLRKGAILTVENEILLNAKKSASNFYKLARI